MMKIKAFTLMEVTVAMLISAICITICYSAYQIVSNYYVEFQDKNEKADATMGLKQALDRDILRGNLVLSTDSGLTVMLDSTVINYTFKNDRILRELVNIHTDTFKLAVTRPQFSFERKIVTEPDTIDQVSFGVALDQSHYVPILLSKLYSSENLFASP